jgi:glutamate-1-semialdehyde 2,1-aminomutase
LDAKAAALADGLGKAAKQAGVPFAQTRVGSMLCGFFADQPVVDYTSAKRSDTQRYAKFFRGMLERGIYFAPSQFEAAFLSTTHSDADIKNTVAAAQLVFKRL